LFPNRLFSGSCRCLFIPIDYYTLIQLIYRLTVSTWHKMPVRIDGYLDAAMT